MSAWRVTGKHLGTILQGIINRPDCCRQVVIALKLKEVDYRNVDTMKPFVYKLVNKFSKINAYAVNCRYGENKQAVPVNANVENPSDVVLMKSIDCLYYQCSEKDTDTKFKKHMNLMQDLSKEIAYKIATCSKEYDDAPWGIDG